MKVLHTIVLSLLFASSSAAQDFPLKLTDVLGDTLTLNAYPERIVSLAPSNTELLFAVNAGGRVVAVTDYCNYPPEAAKKPRIGGFSQSSLELIVSMQPDLVLAARLNPQESLEGLRRFNIPVFVLAPSTLKETLQALRQVGRITGRDTAATRLEAALKDRMEAVERVVDKLEARPRVLWGKLEAPMYTAGPGSFIDDLIRLAGGTNIVHDAGANWPQVGLETIVVRNPEVIVVSSGDPKKIGEALLRLRKTPGWKEIDAVTRGRIHHIDLDLLGRPGPRLVDGLERLAETLHPDRFPQ